MTVNFSKYFCLPTNITSVLLGFNFSQLFFSHELISFKHWTILVIVVWPYVVKDS